MGNDYYDRLIAALDDADAEIRQSYLDTLSDDELRDELITKSVGDDLRETGADRQAWADWVCGRIFGR